jgi:orotidine-5'-phosphate decarboxylase
MIESMLTLVLIGAVVERQIAKAKQITPVHFITVHAAAGPRVLDAVPNNIDVFLVTDMSQQGSQECKMFDHERISGIVSQKLKVPGLMRMVPGISMGKETDQFGQRYRQPKDVSSDLYVVGRGIYNSRMPSRAAKEFKDKLECNKD